MRYLYIENMGTTSPCTCTARACAYGRTSTSSTALNHTAGESEENLKKDFSEMIVKFFDPTAKDTSAPDIVKNDSEFTALKRKIYETIIPDDLQIQGNCIGFCNAVTRLCDNKEGFTNRPRVNTSQVAVPCIIIVVAIILVALLLWSISLMNKPKNQDSSVNDNDIEKQPTDNQMKPQ